MERTKSIAVIGNYLPRKCGIATFSTDLVNALSGADGELDCWSVAINDIPEGYRYPEKVHFEINQNIAGEYKLAADFLNINQIDVVCLQHEYGIYGGEAGSYIISLLRDLRMPIVTTLHTVLEKPSKKQKDVLTEIAALSSRLMVMSKKGIEFLTDIYHIPREKLVFIHHGIPDMPFIDPNFYKDQFGVEGKQVILTFGLLSPNKGIETMIKALPAVVEKHPDAVYIVVGATHPHVRKASGEEYRHNLQRLARLRGVDDHVIFFNRFVEIKELCEFLAASDIYVTPYLSESQIVSGTLAYAMGVGKATVSTPYWYAKEMLAEGRGVLVDFKDSKGLANEVISLLDDDIKRNTMRKKAYTFSRKAVWSQVAVDYINVCNEVKAERACKSRFYLKTKNLEQDESSLPEIDFSHLKTMTDDTGLIQHAEFTVPSRQFGYCIDDNARALIVTVMAQDLVPEDPELVRLQKKYLSFINYAYNEKNGWFRNFMDYDRQWLEEKGAEDSQGRTLWGLGVCSALSREAGCLALSTTLFHKGISMLEALEHPRAIAFALVGIHAYLARFSGDSEVRRIRDKLAVTLFDHFDHDDDSGWPWLKGDILTYASGKIPQALLLSGQWMNRKDMLETGYRCLDWLIDIQKEDDHFSPVGSNGWYRPEGEKARFDQQPIEAQIMLEATLLAFNMSGQERYRAAADMAFNWFLGQNDLKEPLYDYTTGGCRDGLTPDGPNMNEGAESTLAWLLSLLYMQGFLADQKKLHYTNFIEE
ncbi:glycosyltransferase family 4 protein [Sediminispirochaeta bajacaliforniensis]|uniref:glycosyltransferase family 4 protein n=1 Tax=Sediminispirochaeta bajacaliforniensis TaxID=148 RepID=UPI00035F138C|nr:glycosyltransferase family 4 protein [Sediminispirochaeta bajacaliforniensis]